MGAKKGKVYIVGAGPGHPDLITVRGLRVLRRADVVVYDRLIPVELLDEAPLQAEKIYVGKAAGRHALSQEEINKLLLEKALEGKIVVRLKGGDPYVYGRGEEEVLFLRSHGVEAEVIPGVSSFYAALECAGIPLASRLAGSTFAVAPGRTAADRERPRIDYAKLAEAADTLVVLMGLGRIRDIVSEVLKVKPPDTPAAVVVWGCTDKQQVVVSTLGRIADEVERRGLEPPAIIVIGKAVELAGKGCDCFYP